MRLSPVLFGLSFCLASCAEPSFRHDDGGKPEGHSPVTDAQTEVPDGGAQVSMDGGAHGGDGDAPMDSGAHGHDATPVVTPEDDAGADAGPASHPDAALPKDAGHPVLNDASGTEDAGSLCHGDDACLDPDAPHCVTGHCAGCEIDDDCTHLDGHPECDKASGRCLAPWFGLGGFNSKEYLGASAGFGVRGSETAGVSVIALVYLKQVPVQVEMLAQTAESAKGWSLNSSSGGVLRASVKNGTNTGFSPPRTWTEADVQKVHLLALSYDLSAIRMYVDDVNVGKTAYEGYVVAGANIAQAVGSQAATLDAQSYVFLGLAGRDRPLSFEEFSEIAARTREQGELAVAPGQMDHVWRIPSQSTVPVVVPDDVGDDPLSFLVGSPDDLQMERVPRTWAF